MSRALALVRPWAPGLAAAVLAAIVYAGTIGHGFVYDDAFIQRSPMLARPFAIRELFSDGFYAPHERTTGLYRPLGQWTLVLNAELARVLTGSFDRPWIFHAVNVLLHAVASFLVYAWLVRLPIPRLAAAAAAILWAVHPVHAEVAANVTARYESLSLVFGLAYLIAHRSRKWIAASACFLCALLCKESAVAFLPLALAVDAVFPLEGRRLTMSTVGRAVLPALVVLGVWFALRAHALQFENPPTPVVENVTAEAGLVPRALTAAKVQVLYLRDQLLPLWLSSDHSYAQIELVRSAFDPFVLCFLGILVLSLGAAWRSRRSEPGIALAVLGWAILFALASNFLVPIGTIMADRLAYAPSIFTCLLAGLLVAKLGSRSIGPGSWSAWAALAALAIPLAVASFAQARTWSDSLTLFRAQVAASPRSTKAHKNLGDALVAAGRLPEAVLEYREAIAIHERWPEPHLGLAYAYELQGVEPEILIVTFSDGIRYGTTAPRPLRVRALGLVDLGRWIELARLRADAAKDPTLQPFVLRLDHLLRAAELQRTRPDPAADPLAAVEHFRRGEWARAEDAWRRALHGGLVEESELPRVIADLARCHDELGRPERGRWYRSLAQAVSARTQ